MNPTPENGSGAQSAGPLNNPRSLSRVLAVRFSALGDVAMTVPVLYSACRCYPQVRFALLTRRSMVPMFVNPPENLQIIGVDLNEFAGLGGLGRLFRNVREQFPFDGLIDLHDVLRSKVLTMMARLRGIPVAVIHKGRRGKRALTRARNKVLLPLTSQRSRYRQAFHRLGLPVESRFDGLYAGTPTGKADPALFAAVTPPKAAGERWIGIAPFAKHEGKIYPPEMMEQVVEALSQRPSTRIFLFGGGDSEQLTLDGWAERYPGVTSLAGRRLGFPVELALISHLDVMLSMDSANMHLASLTMTPVVSIWGATHPYCGFKGWRQHEEDIVQLPMTCRPCSVFGNRPCRRGDYFCLRGIAPKVIIDRCLSHLD